MSLAREGGLIRNAYINEFTEDQLFHLVFNNKEYNLGKLFGDVKFVCMGGTVRRMKEFAYYIQKEIPTTTNTTSSELEDLTENGHRFSMFKVGCVLCVNHGIGYASITIVLHEVIKLLHHAGVLKPLFFRIGTSGGFGIVEGGTVVIADTALNDYLEECHEIAVLGERMEYPAKLDQNLAQQLKSIYDQQQQHSFPVVLGKTMSHENFYESVASTSGAICQRTNQQRERYYKLLEEKHVLNADMETCAFASITNFLGIKSAIVNVVVNNITTAAKPPHQEAEATATAEMLLEWQRRPQIVVAEYIKEYLRTNSSL